MIHVDLPKITTDNLHYEPFFHIEVPNIIDRKTNDQLHQRYLDEATWEYERKSDKKEYSVLDNVQHARQIEYPEWDKFMQRPWLEELFDVYKLTLPSEFRTAIGCIMHGKGTALIPHTDGPHSSSWRNAEKKFIPNLSGIITQHIYILDSDQYPESGMEFHYTDFDAEDLKPVKQIKALPGSYVSYRNTANSVHGVPEQKQDFNRMLVTIKTFW